MLVAYVYGEGLTEQIQDMDGHRCFFLSRAPASPAIRLKDMFLKETTAWHMIYDRQIWGGGSINEKWRRKKKYIKNYL